MAKNREVLCKQYAKHGKKVEVLKNLIAFLKILVVCSLSMLE